MKNLILTLLAVVVLSSCETVQKEDSETQKPAYTHHSDWSKSAVIYELNIRQFTPQGTFKAIIPHLDRLKDMGIDIIWFMPIHPIGEKNRKGELGSYYSVKDYLEVNPNYGTMADFKELVNEIHARNMFVLIDWVANHTAWDNPWVSEHPDWYTKDSLGNMIPPEGTDWSDVVDLNYGNPEMRQAMIEALQFWIQECEIDGYRCDVADWVPVDFWTSARAALDSINPDVFMLAEAENPKLHPSFDMTYGWEMHHISNEIAKGNMSFEDLENYMVKEDSNFSETAYRMNFTSNHDENSWNGTVFERYGDNYKNWAVVMATIDGMPLLYSGQESKMNERLEFFTKDTIQWEDYPLENFYRSLYSLKDSNEALWNGEYGGKFMMLGSQSDKILAYYRVKGDNILAVIANFDSTEVNSAINSLPEGDYKVFGSNKKVRVDSTLEIKISANDYMILLR